jgi:predicted nucleic acid-binding protein
LLERFIILLIDEIATEKAIILFADLINRGEMIGQADIIIAGTKVLNIALSSSLTL